MTHTQADAPRLYTEEELAAAVLAERERCGAVADEYTSTPCHNGTMSGAISAAFIASTIRKGKPND